MKQKGSILTFILILIILIVVGYVGYKNIGVTHIDKAIACVEAKGKWLEKYNECESPTLPDEFCNKNGGIISGCDSPCRHASEPQMCPAVCIAVCKFGNPSPTPSDTPVTGDWKTYIHPSCGANPEDNKFSIQLPSSFTEKDRSSERGYSYYAYSGDGFNFEISCGAGSPHAGCGEINKEIENSFIVNNEKAVGCMERDSIKNIVNFNVDYWSSNANLPRIFFSGEVKDSTENIKLVNQILFTFKFIK